ncbi:MAG: hypothetical protein U5O15_09045 [Candidatus Krumholzibacteriota bacterium]|nr:hypothetical protein [Candidatus Krumholzibacteriota bacterium]
MDKEKRTDKREGKDSIETSGVLGFILHVIIGIAGWTVFGYFWFVVIKRGVGRGIPIAVISMAVFTFLLVTFTSLWIRHNINISKRNRRRTTPDISPNTYAFDKVGAEVKIEDIEVLKKSPLIEVTVDAGKKIFKPLQVQTEDKG